MKSIKLSFFVAAGVLALWGCYRSPNDTVFYEDLDLVQTVYNPSRVDGNPLNHFANVYDTYVIADSIVVSSNVDDIDEETVNDPAFRINIQESIRRNMDAYGYTELPNNSTETPDVYMAIAVSYINSSGTSWYPIYWGGGWGAGWGYGGGWYYPTFSWVPSYYSFDQGSVHIDWMDFKNAREIPDNDTVFYEINIEWDLSISGLIRNSTDADRNARMAEAIDQGYEQSPYLNKNN